MYYFYNKNSKINMVVEKGGGELGPSYLNNLSLKVKK